MSTKLFSFVYMFQFMVMFMLLYLNFIFKKLILIFLWEINSKFDIPIKALLYMETTLVII